jgi:hypothetical protein
MSLPKATLNDVGRVRIYDFVAGTGWEKLGDDIIGNSVSGFFGRGVDFSKTATIVAIGGSGTDSNTGQVIVFQLQSNDWVQLGQTLVGQGQDYQFGASVALNDDGTLLAVGEIGSSSIAGSLRTFERIDPKKCCLAATVAGFLFGEEARDTVQNWYERSFLAP